jgi:hypothetical protein
MAGKHTDKEKLNRTLEKVCGILNENNIQDWFIMFGTLLGIVRENSCIQGDDDLDIMINCDYQHLRSTFEKQGFNFMVGNYGIKNPDTILKSHPTQEFGSVDFYMCNVNESGDFHTPWNRNHISNCYINSIEKSFIKHPWRNTVLNLPNDYENKLICMYGSDWRVPQARSCKMGIPIQ